MRKMIAAATFSLVAASAGAAPTDEPTPESNAYLRFSFGGERAAPRDLHFGLRLDHDSRFAEGKTAPWLQVDFTRRGLSDTRVNGLSVLTHEYRLRQTDGDAPAAAAAEPVEEEGFFEGMWNGVTGFFGGLFGGDDEDETQTTDAAEAAEAAEEAPEDIAQGPFMSYNAVDWALLAVGAVGLGFVGSEVSNSDDDTDPKEADPPGPGCENPNPVPGGPCLDPVAPFAGAERATDARLDADYQEWLDAGTGHMGDIGN